MTLCKEEVTQILRFWHRIEFFIPFDLQKQVLEAEDAQRAVRSWSVDDLQTKQPLWSFPLSPERQITGFDVYFGVFDKSLLIDVTRQVLRESQEQDEATWEQDERGELEGKTCMAKIRVGPAGEPLLEEVSVSTAPWALGRIQNQIGLASLDFDAFRNGIEGLKERLRQFRFEWTSSSGTDSSQQAKDFIVEPAALSGKELLALLKIFEEWTGFSPRQNRNDTMAVVIRAKSKKAEVNKKEKNTDSISDIKQGCDSQPEGEESSSEDDDEEIADDEDEVEIDILNSFFAKDVERVIDSVKCGEHSAALDAYLSPLPSRSDKRLDLYSPQGRDTILKTLSPARLSTAHWPDEPVHAMSLMQQFAINSLFEQLESGGMFSVNGPPGTGKTTLLRDVFAELITRRARVLASLTRPRDAFTGSIVSVDFRGKKPCRVSQLKEELTGFEMVVASSNNAAVENLSRDLPKTKALGKTGKTPRRDEQGNSRVCYLKTVAHNVAARIAKRYDKLDSDDTPWGLVACALGNKKNRGSFSSALSFDERKTEKPPKGFNPDVHQSLWTWRERYQGPSFATACGTFRTADEAVKQRIALLDRYATLSTQLQNQTLESFGASCIEQVTLSQQALETADTALKELSRERELCKSQLASLREEAHLIEQVRPVWWLRWLYRECDRQHRTDLTNISQQQRDWLTRQRETETRYLHMERQFQRAANHHVKTKQALSSRENEWHALQQEWKELITQFPRMNYPESATVLEDLHWQINGLWHDEVMNKLRSELFAAALGLHEAWLAEVLQKNRAKFGGNIVAVAHLLSGEKLQQREHALLIWQSLFMVVPVISSTFASIASQFCDIGSNSLGWLFIDEAGQAVPQAAVGALWRVKRAVVVGDPMQIEPVFTVPIKLIEGLEREAKLPVTRKVAPHRVSVQNLADQSNALGAWIDDLDEPQWIGSPLRVHRRCVDPMFTIANEIAYQGKMIFFDQDNQALRSPPTDSLDLGKSAWVDIGGIAQNRQVVPDQVELVFQAVVELYQRTGGLPALYVISPFRRIKEALIRKLSDATSWPTVVPVKTLRTWCRERVGTIHTFQGKEESLVWMVLGCDAKTRGAAEWAASKPNLFNVALTRARHRFFVIGDVTLWGGLHYFSNASSERLPRISKEAFLQRVREGLAGTHSKPKPDKA